MARVPACLPSRSFTSLDEDDTASISRSTDEKGSALDHDAPFPRTPDDQVIKMILNDPIAARFWKGDIGKMNPSCADYALAAKLAFYCSRDVDQMYRLFRQSALYGRAKDLSLRGSIDSVRYTLERAARWQTTTWRPMVGATNRRRVGRPRGRCCNCTPRSRT